MNNFFYYSSSPSILEWVTRQTSREKNPELTSYSNVNLRHVIQHTRSPYYFLLFDNGFKPLEIVFSSIIWFIYYLCITFISRFVSKISFSLKIMKLMLRLIILFSATIHIKYLHKQSYLFDKQLSRFKKKSKVIFCFLPKKKYRKLLDKVNCFME